MIHIETQVRTLYYTRSFQLLVCIENTRLLLYLRIYGILVTFMDPNSNHQGNMFKTLDKLNRTINYIEKRFLDVKAHENTFDSDDEKSHLSSQQMERISAAFDYTYHELYYDESLSRLRMSAQNVVPNQGFDEFRCFIANEVERKFLNDATGNSISSREWLNMFDDLSRNRYRLTSQYPATAGRVARDIIVRVLINKGKLRKDDPLIFSMNTD